MGYASISGRARVDPKNPQAFGFCDRCGFTYNLKDLVWQMVWRGNELVRQGFRVCTVTCLDVPFQLNRPLYLPPDPPPVDQPRAGNMAIQESGPQIWDSSLTEYDYDTGLDWDSAGGNTNLSQNSTLPTPSSGDEE